MLMLHSKRVSYVIKLNGNACVAELEVVDPLQYGWIFDLGEGYIFPEWESKENKEIISMTRSTIFKKCGCKKLDANAKDDALASKQSQNVPACAVVIIVQTELIEWMST